MENKTKQEIEIIQEEAYKSGSMQYIDSREVAKMVEKEHDKLRRDIRRYNEQLDTANFGDTSDFWLESIYKDSCGRMQKRYLITRKGCEFIAHKLTGIKGTKFTATYINRFHEMENALEMQVAPVVLQQFMENQKNLLEELVKMNHSMSDRLTALESRKKKQISSTISAGTKPFTVAEDESVSRKKKLNKLITQMAKACGWSRSFALHRLYKTLEEVLDIDIDDYVDIYKEEIQGDACAIDVVIASENLYTTAIRLCNNTLSRMKVEG